MDETPKREPANVTSGASASLQYVRDRTKKVPFPLMVPTVIATVMAESPTASEMRPP